MSKEVQSLESKAENLDIGTFITQSKTQSSTERLEIYTHDYWPRCLDSLEEDFPLLAAFIGKDDFQRLMQRYIQHFPSRNFTLFYLGENLVQYLTDTPYPFEPDFVKNLAHYEWEKSKVFFLPQYPPLDPNTLSEDEKKVFASLLFHRQPCVAPVVCKAHYSAWKPKRLKLPKQRPIYSVIYRDLTNFRIKETVVNYPVYLLLDAFSKPTTLESALEIIWPELEKSDPCATPIQLQSGMNEIIQKGWLYQPKKEI
jgi:hypothetical protein